MRLFHHVLPILKRYYLNMVFGFIVLILVDGVQLLIPKVVQRTVDHLWNADITRSDLIMTALVILGMALLVYALKVLWRLLLIGNAYTVERALRSLYYEKLLRLSANYFNKAQTGDLMARATNDLGAVRMMFGFGFIAAVDAIFLSVASFLFMTSIDLKLTLLAIIPLPILTTVIILMGKRIHYRFTSVQTSFSDLTGMVQENISGVRVVKAFAQEDNELKRMSRIAMEYVRENLKLARLHGFFHPFLWMIILFSFGIVLIWGGTITIRKQITIGEFVAFNSYLGQLIWPMMAIGFIVNLYQSGTASLKRLNEVLDTEPEIVDGAEADPALTTIDGGIEVRDLRFRYAPDLPMIFDGISFRVEPGQTLAIVGPTGCGKSTLVNLLARLYNPPPGQIRIDNRDLYRYPLETLRGSVVMVPQDIFLFSDTIAENIAFGCPGKDREEIEIVAKMASVHEDIVGFEQGYETLIGERGVTLSGGQKQRIAIARAFLCDPSILVLDDSLSAVDTKTERRILEQIVRFRKGKTTVMIAHRISAIQHADLIIVIENGRIAESGTHTELLERRGLYCDLHEKQQIEERLEAGQ